MIAAFLLATALAAPSRPVPAIPDLPIARAPTVQIHTLSGGTRVWILERHEVPLVRIDITLGWGSALTSLGDQLSALHAGMLLGSGTQHMDGATLARSLGSLGATWELGMNEDTLWARLEAPSGAEVQALDLLTSALRAPRFNIDDGKMEKKRWIAWRESLATDLDRVHERAINHAAYPIGHPNRHTATSRMLRRLKARDAQALVERVLAESNPLVVVVGDVEPAAMLEALERALGSLAGRMEGARPPPASTPGRLILVDLPGAPLARISLLTPWPATEDLRRPSATVLSELLVGHDRARIPVALREDTALAYRVESEQHSWNGSGRFVLHTWMEASQAGTGLATMNSVLDGVIEGGLDSDELQQARNHLAMRTARDMSTNRGASATLEQLARQRFAPDYLAAQARVLAMLGPAQVTEAAATFLAPLDRIWVLTGDARQLEASLATAGLHPSQVLTARQLDGEP
jgi:predicted Zn-dependent peptidase